MNIEQKLEAFTQTVELLGGMQIQTEKQMGKLIAAQIETDKRMALVANILLSHDDRLDNLEGNRP